MEFIESYKQLEKLCGEIFNVSSGVSAYIDEMMSTSHGSDYVKDWESDLKKLKHYRWVRNQIVHEPNCTEQNMCESTDSIWIDRFYSRIINQEDPLALYLKATKYQTEKSTRVHNIEVPEHMVYSQKKKGKKYFRFLLFVFVILMIVIIYFGFINYIGVVR